MRSSTTARTEQSRHGGWAHFAVLIDAGASTADAEGVSERLGAALAEPFMIEGHELHLGASVGRAVFPIDAEDADGLLRSADAAMFVVKRLTHPPAQARAVSR
jgi:GGDEF domain-containing protein